MLLLKLKRNVCALVTTSLMFGPQHLLFINFEVLICHNASIYTAETRAVARGGSGGSAEPPLKINDIHDYCYTLEKLRTEVYVLHNTPTFLCPFNLLFCGLQYKNTLIVKRSAF